MWKLTDFGISSQGTTTAGIATAHFRGTQGYRCPELLQDNVPYNKKADVWALGVIVAEFASGTRAFLSDTVTALSYHDSDPKFPIELSSSFWAHHFTEFAGDLLRKTWTERPRMSQVCKMTSMYCQVFEPPIAKEVFQSVEYPSYTGLKHIVEASSSQEEVFLSLGDAFLSKGADGIRDAILTVLWISILEEPIQLAVQEYVQEYKLVIVGGPGILTPVSVAEGRCWEIIIKNPIDAR